MACDRRRLDRPHHRGRAGAWGRPHRPPDEQQGPRRRLPGGARRGAQARRRRDRQHRRRQPVLRARHPQARRADRGRPGRHGRGRPRGHDDRALLAAEEVAAAARLLGRAPGVADQGARHHVGLPRLQPRGRALDPGRLQVHLHARDDHPGRQDARGRRARPDPDEPQAPRVAAVRLDVELHPPQRGLDLPRVRDVRAAARVHDRRGPARARRARRLGAVPVVLRAGSRRRPHPVADPRLGALPGRDRARRARRARRPAVGPADHAAADLRARAPDRARARRAAVALRARLRRDRPAADDRRARRPDAGAPKSARR